MNSAFLTTVPEAAGRWALLIAIGVGQIASAAEEGAGVNTGNTSTGGPAKSQTAPLSGPVAIDAPEQEIGRAAVAVEQLVNRVEAARQADMQAGLGPQLVTAAQAFKAAAVYFDHQEWLSTIRELNIHLNQTQVPDLREYLRAQYMLGRSYEAISQNSRALRAYFRYLSAFLTAREGDHTQLLDVLRRMLPLAATDNNTTRQLDELLAASTALDWPEAVRPTVYYFAAKAAMGAGHVNAADEWLTKAVAGPADAGLKARVLYMQALQLLGRKDYEGAEEVLGQISAIEPSGPVRDLARLALARVASLRQRHDTALRFYASIPEASESFRPALYESIYLHLSRRQDTEARSKAMLFLSRWADAPEALQLRMLLSWLDMRAGDYDAAATGIKSADQGLKDLSNWVSVRLNANRPVSQGMVEDLVRMSSPYVQPVESVRSAYGLFSRLAEAARHLADIRGQVRNLTYAIGRVELRHLRPQWINRAEQLAALSEEALGIGHRLAATERHYYWDRLTGVERQRLTASESRRTRLVTPAAAASLKSSDWQEYSATQELTLRLAGRWEKLRRIKATVAAQRHRITLKDDAQSKSRLAALAEAEKQAATLEQALGATLESLRKRRIESLITQSPHRAAQRFGSRYAMALTDEQEVIRPYRDRVENSAERMNAEDAAKVWQRWEYLMGELQKQMSDLDTSIMTGLATLLSQLDQAERQHDELSARVASLTARLETGLGTSLSYIVDQYMASIDARHARNRKWLADIEGISYRRGLDRERTLNEKFEMEQQILKDNLNDLQQGVLWQWPD